MPCVQGILTWRQPPTLTARVTADIGAVKADACMAEVWSVAAVGLQWHAAASAGRRQLHYSSLPQPPSVDSTRLSTDLRAQSAVSTDMPLGAATMPQPDPTPDHTPAAGSDVSAPGGGAAGEQGAEGDAAEPAAQPAQFQLDARVSLNAASRFALLAPDGVPALTLSSSGVSLLATSEGLPGAATDRRSSAGGALDAVAEHGARPRIGGRQSLGTAAAHGHTASAAATPQALRASREVPPTPRSASAWLRGGAAGFGGGGGGTTTAAPRAALLRSGSPACRLDLGTLTVSIACGPDGGSGRGSSAPQTLGDEKGPALPSAFENSSSAVSDYPFASESAAATAQAQQLSAQLSQLLRIETVQLDLIPQPPAAPDTAEASVQYEGESKVSIAHPCR